MLLSKDAANKTNKQTNAKREQHIHPKSKDTHVKQAMMQSRNVAVLQNATSCLVQLLVASRAPDSRCTRCTKYVYIPPNFIFSKHTSLLLIGDVICVLAVHKIGRCHDRTQKYTSPINLVLFSSIPPSIFLLLHFLLCLSTCPFPSLSPYTYLLPTSYLPICPSFCLHLSTCHCLFVIRRLATESQVAGTASSS